MEMQKIIKIGRDLILIYMKVLDCPDPITFGGAGSVVQVDESLFHHKPKVYFANFNFIEEMLTCHSNDTLKLICAVEIFVLNQFIFSTNFNCSQHHHS